MGFHVRHAAGSLDRLFTYARGERLSSAQRASLDLEKQADLSPGAALALLAEFDAAVDAALVQLRATTEASLLETRGVGRQQMPSTVLGLLFHAAEHTQRHVGQVVTTLRIAASPSDKAPVTTRAAGTFEVTLTPLPLDDVAEGILLGRLSIRKRFHGDLDASSSGEMLSAGTSVKTSAGYVAIERVSGTLHGRVGTFVLQHTGTMTRGQPQLVVSIVPDSGTGELSGLIGTMTISIAPGVHAYEMQYAFGERS
ncbi:MAG: hypothetical protein V7647_2123 [Acidobacteriota bacterium]